MSVSEILYGFMFVGIVLANVIVLADDNWRERQIVPYTIRIFVGCEDHLEEVEAEAVAVTHDYIPDEDCGDSHDDDTMPNDISSSENNDNED